MKKTLSLANANTTARLNGGKTMNITFTNTSSATATKTLKEDNTMENTNTVFANTTVDTSKEVANMNTNTNTYVPVLAKAINCGITTPDIEKFFSIPGDEIVNSLNSYYTRRKVFISRILDNLALNDSSDNVSKKRVSFSDELVESALFLIKNGATMADLSRCFNIKEKKTIKKWLVAKWPRAGKKHFDLLLENEKLASKTSDIVSTIMSEEIAEELSTYEDWYGEPTPEVDCLISCYMTLKQVDLAKDYCEQHGLTYKVSNQGPCVNVEAALLGRPTVISDSTDLQFYCEMDAIPFLDMDSILKNVVHYEHGDPVFSSKKDFISFKKSKSGIFFVKCNDLASEQLAKLQFSTEATCKILVATKDNMYKEAPEQFGLKKNQTFIVLIKDNGTIYSWKYQLSSDGHFREVGYASGPYSLADYILEKIS